VNRTMIVCGLALLFVLPVRGAEQQADPRFKYSYQPKPTDILEWNDTTLRPSFFHLGPYADQFLDEKLAFFRKQGFTNHAHWDRDYVLAYSMLYENRYDQLTDAERQKLRAYFAERAYSVLDTDLTAQPVNLFVIDKISVAGMFALLFPQHPDYARFRDAYFKAIRFVDRQHIRPDMPHRGAWGGRYIENVGCYEPWAFGERLLVQAGLYLRDPGANVQPDGDLVRWLRYRLNILSAPVRGETGDGVDTRLAPPQGAHAAPHGRFFISQSYGFSALLENYAPRLRDAWAWLYLTNGPWHATTDMLYDFKSFPPSPVEHLENLNWKGARPSLRSEKFWDFGAIFRRDFGTPQEMAVEVAHVQSTNYRWGQNQSGQIFYYADGKAWSWNGAEDSGDNQAKEKFGNRYITAFATIHDGHPLMIGKTHTTENLYDFGFAGQYTIPGNDGYDDWGKNGDYRARSVMLINKDFLAIFDNVRTPEITGDFRWFNRVEWSLPNIVQVKPGAGGVPVDNNYSDGRNSAQHPACKGLSFVGKGDFLTVVSHKPVTAVSTDYGTLVNGQDKIFVAGAPLHYATADEIFTGTSGYIAGNKLALFAGTQIGAHGFRFEKPPRDDQLNNFGFAVEIRGDHDLAGQAAGQAGDLTIHLPYAPTATDKLFVNGHEIKYSAHDRTVTFHLPKRLEGQTVWQWTNQSAAPIDVTIVGEAAGNGAVQLAWTTGGDAARYDVEAAANWGTFTAVATAVTNRGVRLAGLQNEVPYVLRVRARTERGAGDWSAEIISVPTVKLPAGPNGLEALDYYGGEFYNPAIPGAAGSATEPETVDLHWGEVRGATAYRLERQAGSDQWAILADDLNHGSFIDDAAYAGITYTYRVTAKNLNGWGTASQPLVIHRGPTARKPAFFGIGFTKIGDTNAQLVFTSTTALRASVEVIDGDTQVVKRMTEDQPTEIHRIVLAGLTGAHDYLVTMRGTTEVKVKAVPAEIILRTGLRPIHADQFAGRTMFGIGHVDELGPLTNLGAGLVRYSPTWDRLQPEPGKFDDAALAQMVKDVAGFKKAGVEPLVLLCFSVPWAKAETDRLLHWRHPAFGPPDRLADWQVYVRKVMEMLKGQVHYYEIWNEPDAGYLAMGQPVERTDLAPAREPNRLYQNNDEYWLGDRYVPLVMTAREVADAIDPSISVLAPSWNHDYHGTRGELCFNRGLDRYLQQYSIHTYVGDPHSFELWKDWTDRYLTNAGALFTKHHVAFPIAVTEWGVRSYDDGTHPGFTSRRDAQLFLLKSAFYYLSLEKISMLVLHQMGYNDEWSLINKPDGQTLVYTPAFATYRWLCHTFDRQAYANLPITTAPDNSDLETHAIRLIESGAILVAVWQNHPRHGETLGTKPAGEISLRLPAVAAGQYRRERLNAVGDVSETTTVQANDGVSWTASLPAAIATGESEPLLYRLTPQSQP